MPYNKGYWPNQTCNGILKAMREAGAGQRSWLQADTENQRNQMEQQRFLSQYPGQVLDNQIKLDDLANRQEVGALRNQLRTLTPGTPEYDEIEAKVSYIVWKVWRTERTERTDD